MLCSDSIDQSSFTRPVSSDGKRGRPVSSDGKRGMPTPSVGIRFSLLCLGWLGFIDPLLFAGLFTQDLALQEVLDLGSWSIFFYLSSLLDNIKVTKSS